MNTNRFVLKSVLLGSLVLATGLVACAAPEADSSEAETTLAPASVETQATACQRTYTCQTECEYFCGKNKLLGFTAKTTKSNVRKTTCEAGAAGKACNDLSKSVCPATDWITANTLQYQCTLIGSKGTVTSVQDTAPAL